MEIAFFLKTEIRLGEIAGKGFKDNFWSLSWNEVLAAPHLALVKIQRVLPNGLKNFLFLADLLSEN
jgi:hypothetical protein